MRDGFLFPVVSGWLWEGLDAGIIIERDAIQKAFCIQRAKLWVNCSCYTLFIALCILTLLLAIRLHFHYFTAHEEHCRPHSSQPSLIGNA